MPIMVECRHFYSTIMINDELTDHTTSCYDFGLKSNEQRLPRRDVFSLAGIYGLSATTYKKSIGTVSFGISLRRK